MTNDLLVAPGDYPSSIHAFIRAWAETRHFKDAVEKVTQVDPDLLADLQNAYGVEALPRGKAA